MKPIYIIKIGGNIIDDEQKLYAFLREFSALKEYKILVHGGGKIASEIGHRLGIFPDYHQGKRITDAATLELVTMVYGGLVNKKIIAALQSFGCNAIGLAGCDGNIIQATKRLVKDVDYGFVGDINIDGIKTSVLNSLLECSLTPVIAPLTHDGKGNLLNTNADTIAQEIAKAFVSDREVNLVFCFDKDGVLEDAMDENSVIPFINQEIYQNLRSRGIISNGMIPKLDNAFSAIKAGIKKVIIGNASHFTKLIKGQNGTLIS